MLSGQLLFYFGAAIIVSVIVSLAVLHWHRVATTSVVRRSGTTPAVGSGDDVTPAGVSIADVEAAHEISSKALRALGTADPPQVVRCRRRLAIIYGAASLAAAGWLAFVQLRSFGSDSFSVFRLAILWVVHGWMLVPTLAAVLALSRPALVRLALGYTLFAVAGILAWSVVSRFAFGRADVQPLTNLYFAGVLAAQFVPIPLALIALTGNRRLRGVAPVAFGAVLTFSVGLLVFIAMFTAALDRPAFQGPILAVQHLTGDVMLALYLVLSLPIGYAVWIGLQWLIRRFREKAFSEVQLAVASWWLIAILLQSVERAAVSPWFAALNLLALPIFVGVAAVGLRYWGADPPDRRRSLLLLRVFGFQRRTEQLFDRVAARWRFRGDVAAIAGADLAMRMLDARGVALLLEGNVGAQFVGAQAVEARMAAVDDRPDPDGRYRVNALYCYDDSWRATVGRLIDRSGAILMDLRGFDRHRKGCIFEVQSLAKAAAGRPVVLVVDRHTDLPLLRRILADAEAADAAGLRIVHAETNGWKEVAGLLTMLEGRAERLHPG
jgi:hypothetical protein